MANTTIQIKKSGTPTAVPTNLANGELAINYADGKLFYKAANGTIAQISGAGGSSANTFATMNANGTLVVADSASDILSFVSGNNISIVGDAVNDSITVALKDTVTISGDGSFGKLFVTGAAGDEGGEMLLAKPITNSTLAGTGVTIDVYQNKLRFFEQGGTARGAYIDISLASAGAGSDLLSGAGGADTEARATAAAAFDKANSANVLAFNALPNTSGAVFNGRLSVTQNLSADKIISSNNGLSENFRIGDDAWLGDTNIADTFRIKGVLDPTRAYIIFNTSDNKALGRAGSGALTWDSNTIWHAGNDGASSGLDADLLDGQQGTYYATATDSAAAFAKANAAPEIANSYATVVGAASNTWANTVGTSGNSYALTTATSIGASANNWANTKLANTSGVSFSGDLTVTGNVGIGTAHSSNFRLEVVGAFAATTKSFVIPHPSKENMSLRYGSLEGPENGVYVRGIATSDVIDLPDYWSSLVDESTVTVNLTGINSKPPSVNRIENNKVYLNKPLFSKIHCYYTVFAERKDVDKLIVEY